MLTVIGQVRNTWVLRLGEMHTVMAALRAVGNVIEDSGAWWGLKWSWHGLITTRQILEVKYMTRALEAHTHMTTILYVIEFFLDHPHLKGPCTTAAQQLDRSIEAVFNIYKKMLCWRSDKKCRVLSIPKEYWLWWLSLMRRRKDRARCSSLWGATWGWC